jgi:hypothetical protein
MPVPSFVFPTLTPGIIWEAQLVPLPGANRVCVRNRQTVSHRGRKPPAGNDACELGGGTEGNEENKGFLFVSFAIFCSSPPLPPARAHAPAWRDATWMWPAERAPPRIIIAKNLDK